MKLFRTSFKEKVAIFEARFPAPSLDKRKVPLKHQTGKWVTEGNGDASPAASISPEKVNKICLVFGIIQDILFLVGYYFFLIVINRNNVNKYYAFNDCSTVE